MLYHDDNIKILHTLANDSVDLVYLDPPFASGRDYGQFDDRWYWNIEAQEAYDSAVKLQGHVALALESLKRYLGISDIMAYLCMMAPRLTELHRVLKSTGSLYLHCDPTASHYLKLLLDAVFSPACFRNEIIWRYRRWPTKSRQLQKMHDVLLLYSKSPSGEHKFNTLYGYEKLADSTLKAFGTKKQKADFSSGHRKPSTEDQETQGPPLSDVWEVGIIAPIAKERTGYPTQKPEALLERVILSSSDEGDTVLDPFCGSGTTLVVADRFKRRWIGIDSNSNAIDITRRRLNVH